MKWSKDATEEMIRKHASEHLKHAPARSGGGGHTINNYTIYIYINKSVLIECAVCLFICPVDVNIGCSKAVIKTVILAPQGTSF